VSFKPVTTSAGVVIPRGGTNAVDGIMNPDMHTQNSLVKRIGTSQEDAAVKICELTRGFVG
jgi:hypothetical protein